jgi:hypothetical protein
VAQSAISREAGGVGSMVHVGSAVGPVCHQVHVESPRKICWWPSLTSRTYRGSSGSRRISAPSRDLLAPPTSGCTAPLGGFTFMYATRQVWARADSMYPHSLPLSRTSSRRTSAEYRPLLRCVESLMPYHPLCPEHRRTRTPSHRAVPQQEFT